MGGAQFIPKALLDLEDFPASYAGAALRRPRVNINETATTLDHDDYEVIRVEEASADVRSTARPGYSSFKSYVGLQTLIDNAGSKKTFLLPANGIFDLDGNMLKTKAARQRIAGGQGRAMITNGGIQLDHIWGTLSNLEISGTNPYGIDIRAAFCTVENSDLYYQTTAGVNIPTCWAFYATLLNMRIVQCAGKGIYAHMSDGPIGEDLGDLWINAVKVYGCTGIGMHFGRIGGVNIIGSKVQSCTGGGLLFKSEAAQPGPTWGHYISGSSFEDNTGWDFKTDMDSMASYYPDRIQVVGGTIHKTVITHGKDIVFGHALLPISIAVNATQGTVIFDHCPPVPKTITGTGKWIAYDMDTATGNLWIRTSTRVRITSQDGDTYVGPAFTSIASTPPKAGIFAVVGGVGYMSTGTSSPADWKQITN